MIDLFKIVMIAVLFNHLGLADKIVLSLHLKKRNYIINCSKCLSFWSSLLYTTIVGCRLLDALFASFAAAYLSLWVELALGCLTRLYYYVYEKTETSEDHGEVSEN